ncbi:hypothetical protein NPIL_384961 [Nephila pilipes]|uniref:Uncharacterized protein n=1 Tax=Nephila pilipes TaxID=299642 RepID=A0A8X6QGW2_NEPPI|nr:hypothetical protein NPIL_384961 [Nephila pilipes]
MASERRLQAYAGAWRYAPARCGYAGFWLHAVSGMRCVSALSAALRRFAAAQRCYVLPPAALAFCAFASNSVFCEGVSQRAAQRRWQACQRRRFSYLLNV